MKPAPFTYHAPATVDEAVDLLGRFAANGARIIAGGQSLVAMMAFRLARPGHLIDINGIAPLQTIAVEAGMLRIGALVRHAAIEDGAAPGPLGRLLAAMAGHVAHRPIRTRGTFCGSLVNADPSSEWCLAMATLDGHLVLRSPRGERSVPAAAFFQGVMTTALDEDELVVEARLPVLTDDACFGFNEVSRRAGDFAMAAGLVTYRLASGLLCDVRVGVGGAEPHPRRISEAERVLEGEAPGADLFRRAAEAAAAAVDPMEDGQNPPDYRRRLVHTVTLRALEASRA